MALQTFSHDGPMRRAPKEYTAEAVMVIVCLTLALYNALELLGLIFMTFKKRQGLYFWSIFLASFAIIPYSVGRAMDYFDLTIDWISMIFECGGWVFMVSGQSVVLYSRLHLVLNDARILRAVLVMIVVNGVVWHPTVVVLLFGTNYSPYPARRNFSSVYDIVERVQMTFFCIQEFILSGIYMWKTLDILRTSLGNKRRFMWHLFGINVLIVLMDIGLLVLEYKNKFAWQRGVKVAVYSVKLKLEFAVLGELVNFVQRRGTQTNEFVELPSNRTQTSDRKRRSTARPNTLHVENMKTTVVKAPVPSASTSQASAEDEITVTTRFHVDRDDAITDGEDANHMYEIAVKQISRSK
ncbi:hypothetical protein B0J13DRAFT_154561 [Dactylonectria estremocensis]|uniref:DUF7703 domain-containing protein n=1 Tax=Dactylonectria estremocensis TaxID=1079267 RepID=A0A9P9DQJ3_9HYPO|nr:hypothetical protein B0J13DRAFT_154561 [Dactylonectria estremocensis]